MKFNLIVAVWGRDYIDCFCDVTLPSLAISKGDTDVVSAHSWKLVVYAPEADHDRIRATSHVRLPFAVVDCVVYEPDGRANPYTAMSVAHHRAALQTIADSAWAVVVPPDAVFSAGSLRHVAEMCASGKRAVMVNGPRLREVGALAELRDALAGSQPLSGRELSGILMRHVHPEWRRYHWASSNFSTRPFALMWDAPGGWLCRNFHLHPLAVDLSVPQAMECLRTDTIDGEFVGRAIGVWDDIHVVQDSDDLLMCTLTPDDVTYSKSSEELAGLAAVRRTAYEEANVNALHRWYLTKATKIHTGDLDARWKAIEEETGHLIFEVLSQHRMQDIATVNTGCDRTIMTGEHVTYEALAGNTTPSAGVDRYDNVLEEGVRISDGTQMQGHCSVGRHTELNGATLYPLTKVGRYCSIAKNAALGASNHPITGLSSSLSFPSVMGDLRLVGAEIGHDVWVGTNATVLAGVKIGHGAVIGANALVTKDVRPYAIVIGQPAREVRRRFSDDLCHALLVSRWWEVPYAALRDVMMSDPVEALRRIVGLRREAADIEPEAIAFLEDWLASRPPAIAVAG